MHKYASAQSQEYDQGVMVNRRAGEHNKRFSVSVGSLLGESSGEDSDSVVLHLVFVSKKRQWIVWMTTWMLLKWMWTWDIRRSSSTVRVCGWLLASVMDRCSNRSLNMKLFAVLIFFLLFLAWFVCWMNRGNRGNPGCISFPLCFLSQDLPLRVFPLALLLGPMEKSEN